MYNLTVGQLVRVANKDNRAGSGAKGHLKKNDDGSWTLVSFYKTNSDITFTESQIGWTEGFYDDEHGKHVRIQLVK